MFDKDRMINTPVNIRIPVKIIANVFPKGLNQESFVE